MFETVKQANLLPSDLAKLLKVNRCTVSNWFNGKNHPHPMIKVKLNKLLDAVHRAVDAGDLPVPHDVKRRERAHYISERIVKHLRSQQEAA